MMTMSCDTDKGEGTDADSGFQEDEVIIQDEIYKSRLASIKRVCCYLSAYFLLLSISNSLNILNIYRKKKLL